MTEIVLKILDMECAACVRRLNKHIHALEGVSTVNINFTTQSARIIYDENKTNISRICSHIEKAGFRVPDVEVDISLYDSKEIQEFVEKLKAMREVKEVKYSENISDTENGGGNATIYSIITLVLWPIEYDVRNYIKIFSDSGITASISEIRGSDEEWELEKRMDIFKLLIESVACTSLQMLELHPKLQFIVGTALQFGPGGYFYKGALRDIRNKNLGMDTLIASSSTLIYLYSSYVALTRKSDLKLYFSSDAVLLSLILFGKYIEQMATGEAGSAIKKLLHLAPKTVRIQADDQIIEKSVDEINEGEIVLVRAGERIPVDGTIVSGDCTVDESMITGESIPVDKSSGCKVIGGTLCRAGTVYVSAENLGKDSTLSQIISTVRKAQFEKAPVQKFADSIASWFVPAVIGSAGAVFTLWYKYLRPGNLEKAILTSCDVLSVACPCALGLATPTALMVASGAAAENGIFFSSGRYIENAHKCDTIIFDKTGTLTTGNLEVHSITTFDGFSSDEILSLCASLEVLSDHPVANAITEYASDALASFHAKSVSHPEIHGGYGISGDVDGKHILCGNRKFMNLNDIDVDSYSVQNSSTEVYVSVDGKPAGAIIVSDTLKKEAKSVIEGLKAAGKDVWLVTGDSESSAEEIAASVGIEHVEFSILPTEKADLIKKLRSEGRTICMVGDGINDTPALVGADCSIAMGTGSDIAIESSGICLPSSNLTRLFDVFDISEQTMNVVHDNLKRALGYNLVSIPIAAAGLLHPSICATSMSLSSIGVLMNSLRLRNYKSHDATDFEHAQMSNRKTALDGIKVGAKKWKQSLRKKLTQCM